MYPVQHFVIKKQVINIKTSSYHTGGLQLCWIRMV